MKHDIDLAALSKSWQQQPVDPVCTPTPAALSSAKRRQRRQWLLLGVDWSGAAVMAGTALWLLTTVPGWLSYLAGLFLCGGVLMSLYVSWHVHKPVLAYGDWSSNGLLAFRLRCCQLSLWYARYNQLACVLLIGFAAALWLLAWWQPAQVPPAVLKFYSLVAVPLCLLAIYRLQQHSKAKQRELAALQRLLNEFAAEVV